MYTAEEKTWMGKLFPIPGLFAKVTATIRDAVLESPALVPKIEAVERSLLALQAREQQRKLTALEERVRKLEDKPALELDIESQAQAGAGTLPPEAVLAGADQPAPESKQPSEAEMAKITADSEEAERKAEAAGKAGEAELAKGVPEPEAKPEQPAPEPPVRAGGEEDEPSIFELASQSAQADETRAEEWDAKIQTAHLELNEALVKRGIWINPDAEFVDQRTDYVRPAYFWLQVQIAKDKMTADEGIAYAEKQEGWVEISSEPLYEFFRLRGLKLHAGALVKGKDINIPDRLSRALLQEEVDGLDHMIQVAKDAHWAKPLPVRPDSDTRGNGAPVGDILRTKAAEDAADGRKPNGSGKGHGRDRKRGK